ncbi:hypothetical protein GGF32_002850 [Allomyces javanicus]|nr:hypothetical protein GGF32_002850 [Allomyces javanicus]
MMIRSLAHRLRPARRALDPVAAAATVTTRLFSVTAVASRATATATTGTTPTNHDDHDEYPPRVTPAPAPPKPPMTAFMRYALHALDNRPVDDAPPMQYWMKTMGEQWHALPANERDQYVAAYARDKQVYHDALQAYKEKYSPLQHKLYKLAKAKADYVRLKRQVDQDLFRAYGPTREMEYMPDTIPTPRQLFMHEYRQQEQDKWWNDPSLRGDKPPTCAVLDKQARKIWNAMLDTDRQRYVEEVHDLVEQAFQAI